MSLEGFESMEGRAMETYLQADAREIEHILRRIEAAENTGNSAEIADMLELDLTAGEEHLMRGAVANEKRYRSS